MYNNESIIGQHDYKSNIAKQNRKMMHSCKIPDLEQL